jgi:hypothetical protein
VNEESNRRANREADEIKGFLGIQSDPGPCCGIQFERSGQNQVSLPGGNTNSKTVSTPRRA